MTSTVDPLTAKLRTFESLDRLPRIIERAICFAARVYDAWEIETLYKRAVYAKGKAGAATWLIQSIEANDEQDVIGFAKKYERRHKVPFPHVAADATILRYRPPQPPKHVARIRRVQPKVRAAWLSSERLLPQ